VKYIFGIDDSMDIFAQHGVGGVLGLLANGIFAADYVISLDNINTTVKGAKRSSHSNFSPSNLTVIWNTQVDVSKIIASSCTSSLCTFALRLDTLLLSQLCSQKHLTSSLT
jgi:ammonia channel protein AmtB